MGRCLKVNENIYELQKEFIRGITAWKRQNNMQISGINVKRYCNPVVCSGSQPSWHPGWVSWKTIFIMDQGRGDGLGMI